MSKRSDNWPIRQTDNRTDKTVSCVRPPIIFNKLGNQPFQPATSNLVSPKLFPWFHFGQWATFGHGRQPQKDCVHRNGFILWEWGCWGSVGGIDWGFQMGKQKALWIIVWKSGAKIRLPIKILYKNSNSSKPAPVKGEPYKKNCYKSDFV